MKRRIEFVVATAAYALFWIVNRWPAIRANVLLFDDFEIPFHPLDFYWGGYRPTLQLELFLRNLIAPHSFWTVAPKIFGAVYIGIAAALLIELLRAWDVPPGLARVLPLVVVAHPLLADGPLWQTYAGLPIVPALITGGAIAWTYGRKLAFALLTLAGVLGYQIYITLAVVYAIAEPVVRRRRPNGDDVLRIGIIGGCAVVQLIVTAIIRHTYGHADPRGIVNTFNLKTQIHGMFDLVVNVWMPVIAYYAGAMRAMSLWKYVPLALAAATAIATRRAIPTIFAAAIFVVPALPNVLLAEAPTSWRVSTPEVYAFVLALLPLLLRVPRAAAITIVVVLAAILVPVSWYESWCRVESWTRDQRFVASLDPSDAIVLAPINPHKLEDESLAGPHDLTWAYSRRTPRMWSEFNDAWMAKHFLLRYEHLGMIDCDATPSDARCAGAAALCATGRNDAPVEYPRAVRDAAQRRTIVCSTPAALRSF